MKTPAVRPTPAAPDTTSAPPVHEASERAYEPHARTSPDRRAPAAQPPHTPSRLRRRLPSGDDGGRLERSFAEVQAAVNIVDADATRAEATRQLLELLAAQLGLRADGIEIRVNGEAADRTAKRQARGVMADGVVYLHPQAYDPATHAGAHLLAHEVAHVAQRALTVTNAAAVTDVGRAHAQAEAEADRVARAFVETRLAPRVTLALPVPMAADNDAEKVPDLDDTVKNSRAREIRRIKDLLKTGLFDWAITDGEVDEILGMLSFMPFVVAKAVVGALEPDERIDLVDNISDSHKRNYRPQVLACFAALKPKNEKGQNEFRRFDQDIFRRIDLKGLRGEEREAALYALRHMDWRNLVKLISGPSAQETLVEYLRAGNFEEVKKLILSREPTLEEQEAQRRKQAEAAQNEATRATELAKEEQAARRFEKDGTAQAQLAKLEKLLSRPVWDSDATEALNLLGSLNDGAKFDYLTRALEQKGLLARLVEELPEDKRFDTPQHEQTLLAVLKRLPPEKNIAIAQDLLSYNVIDWAVRDPEARFAYRLIKILPPEAQYRFRQLDSGKWYARLEANINAELVRSGEYRGIEVQRTADGQYEDVAALQARLFYADEAADRGLEKEVKEKRDQQRARYVSLLDELIKDCEKGIDADTAPVIFSKLTEIGHPARAVVGERTTFDTFAITERRDVLAYVVRRLDTLGYIDRLFSSLSEPFLLAENRRADTLTIMAARDPIHQQRHARDLIDRGFFHTITLGIFTPVTDREAYLAYQLLRALPDAEREAFMAEDGGERWQTILGEMTSEMRLSSDVNAYMGDKGGFDRASVLGQLADPALWSAKHLPRLDGLIRMALAMGEGQWVFEQSRRVEAYVEPGLDELVERYQLYNDTPIGQRRTQYKPRDFTGNAWYEEGIFQTLATAGKGLWFFASNILFVWGNNLAGRSIGGQGIDLNQLQGVLGGDVKGVKLASVAADAPRPPRQRNRKNHDKIEQANKLTLWYDVGQGVLELKLPQLRIEAINYQSGSMNLQTGPVTLNNLDIKAGFATSGWEKPAYLNLTLDSVAMDDLLLAFRQSMVTLNQLDVTAPEIHGGVSEAENKAPPEARTRDYIPLPIITKIFGLIYHVFRLKGWLSKSLMDEGMEGVQSLRAFEVKFDSLEAQGLTTSGGQTVRQLSITDFAMRAGLNKATYLRGLIASLSERLEQASDEAQRATLRGQRDKARADLQAAEQTEAEVYALQRKAQTDPDGMKPDDHKRLLALQADLTGGAVLDIGSVTAKGIGGAVSMEDVDLTNLHGEGESATLGIAFLTDEAMLRRFVAGGQPPSIKEQAGDAAFHLDIERFRTRNVQVRGGVPSPTDVQKEIDRLLPLSGHPKVDAEVKRLRDDVLPKAERYAWYVARGVSALDDARREDFVTIQREFEHTSFSVASVDLQRAQIGVNVATGALSVGAKGLDATGITKYNLDGSVNLSVGEVYGRDVALTGQSREGIAGLLDLPKTLKTGTLTAAQLTVRDFEHPSSGAKVEELDVKDLRAELDTNQGDAKVRLKGTFTVKGASLTVEEAALRAELQGLKARAGDKPTRGDAEKIAKIQAYLDDLDAIRERDDEATLAFLTAKTAREKAAAQKLLAEVERDRTDWHKRLVIDKLSLEDLDVTVSGLGDIFSDNYDFNQVLKKGITVEGTGGGDWFKRLTVEGARQRGAKGTQIIADLASLGASGGRVELADDKVSIKTFHIANATVRGASYAAGDYTLASKGTTQLTNIRIEDAYYATADETKIGIKFLRIEEIAAGQLSYETPDLKVTLESGSLQGFLIQDLVLDIPPDAPPDPDKEKAGKGEKAEKGKGPEAKISGQISLARAHNLATRALMGDKRVDATLNGSALSVQFVNDKQQQQIYKIGDLSASATVRQLGTKNTLHVILKHLAGEVTRTTLDDGDAWDIKGLRLGEVRLTKGSHWEADNAVIDVKGEATATGIAVDARIVTHKDGDKTKVRSARITQLTVDEIQAAGDKAEPIGIEVLLKATPGSDDGKGKKTQPSEQKRFQLEKGTIKGLRMTGFDLLNRTGKIEVLREINIEKLKATIGEEGKGAVQKGTISFRAHGKESDVEAMRGRELSAELRTDGMTLQIGTVEKIVATDVTGRVAATSLESGKVTTGPIEITDDKVSIPDIKIASLDAVAPAYKDDKGTEVKLAKAKITGITLPYLEAEFGDVPDEKGVLARGLARIKLGRKPEGGGTADMLVIDKIEGEGFSYSGESETPDKKGKSRTEVSATKATLLDLRAANIERDFVKKITAIDGRLKSVKLDGFSLLLKDTLGTVEKSKKLLADVEASGLSAKLTLSQTTANGKPWTSVDGDFELDTLGLTKVRYFQPEPGKAVKPGDTPLLSSDEAKLTGLKAKFAPNGTAYLKFDDLAAKNVALTLNDITAKFDFAELKGFALGLKGLGLEKGEEILGLKLSQFQVKGMSVVVKVDRRKQDTAAAADKTTDPGAGGAAGPAGKPARQELWKLEPLGDMQGDLHVTYDTGFEADIGIPIRNGVIDFDDVSNPTYGVFAELGVDERGIYADISVKGRKHLYEPPNGAGLTPETWAEGADNSQHIDKRGKVDLRRMIEAAMNEPSAGGSTGAPADLSELNKVGLSGGVQLGKGVLGKGKNFIELAGSAGGNNSFTITSTRIGRSLTLTAPVLSATRGNFEFDKKPGTTGAIQFTNFSVEISNLGSPTLVFDVTIRADDGTISDVQFGDVGILNADGAGLRALPAPKK